MDGSRGGHLAITLAKDHRNRARNLSTMGKLVVDIFKLLRDSQSEIGETMCQILSKGVVAVLGPSASPASNSIISNICGEKEASELGMLTVYYTYIFTSLEIETKYHESKAVSKYQRQARQTAEDNRGKS